MARAGQMESSEPMPYRSSSTLSTACMPNCRNAAPGSSRRRRTTTTACAISMWPIPTATCSSSGWKPRRP